MGGVLPVYHYSGGGEIKVDCILWLAFVNPFVGDGVSVPFSVCDKLFLSTQVA